ncbi:MAG TPA: hypothetical protein VHT91_43530 [Kofleriaceae bacterium]|nr:hypothetical protein [Kofleriaceae bacterium]
MLPLVVAAIATGTARAEQARPDEPRSSTPFALAVNVLPVASDAFAVSAWIGRDAHHAIRANVARYRGPLWLRVLAPVFSDGEEDSDVAPDFGTTTDLGLGWVYYPRRLLDGASVEAGVLCRFDRRRNDIDEQDAAAEEHHTNVYSGRLLVGWTWRLSDWWFVATAAGGALGYERGHEKTYVGVDGHGDVSRSGPVSRVSVSFESYVRLGMAFGQ